MVPLSCPAPTTTVASQRPASDWARAGAARLTRPIAARPTKTAGFVFMCRLPEKQKARDAEKLPGLLSAVRTAGETRLHRDRRAARQAGAGSGRTTRAAAIADDVHACTVIGEIAACCQPGRSVLSNSLTGLR